MYLISLAYITFFLLIQVKTSFIRLNVAFLVVLALWSVVGGISWQIAVAFGLVCGGHYVLTRLSLAKQLIWLIDGAILFIAAALLLHIVPGFYNVLVIDNISLGDTSSVPYSMYINYDKALAGLLILLCLCQRNQVIGKVNVVASAKAVGGAIAVVVLAIFSLNLQFDPKWLGQASLLFIFVKSFSTAFVEEIIFRGVIQTKLARWLSPKNAWILASMLFAIVHVGAGGSYVLTAFVAGLIYGHIFNKYQSILLASLCHCLVNIVHFSFLTYPM